mmetsp:Transcript_16183/g.41243  ORF Transcript_16183/g.41243 Transcript_16183/m.41243 type:complete len:485 (-) Transcript_16183:441-1895(-)
MASCWKVHASVSLSPSPLRAMSKAPCCVARPTSRIAIAWHIDGRRRIARSTQAGAMSSRAAVMRSHCSSQQLNGPEGTRGAHVRVEARAGDCAMETAADTKPRACASRVCESVRTSAMQSASTSASNARQSASSPISSSSGPVSAARTFQRQAHASVSATRRVSARTVPPSTRDSIAAHTTRSGTAAASPSHTEEALRATATATVTPSPTLSVAVCAGSPLATNAASCAPAASAAAAASTWAAEKTSRNASQNSRSTGGCNFCNLTAASKRPVAAPPIPSVRSPVTQWNTRRVSAHSRRGSTCNAPATRLRSAGSPKTCCASPRRGRCALRSSSVVRCTSESSSPSAARMARATSVSRSSVGRNSLSRNRSAGAAAAAAGAAAGPSTAGAADRAAGASAAARGSSRAAGKRAWAYARAGILTSGFSSITVHTHPINSPVEVAARVASSSAITCSWPSEVASPSVLNRQSTNPCKHGEMARPRGT